MSLNEEEFHQKSFEINDEFNKYFFLLQLGLMYR